MDSAPRPEAQANPALPGFGRILPAQFRYQMTLLVRTPRALILGIAMPALLLALEMGRRHPGTTALTAAVGGLVVFGALSIAYLSYGAGLVVAREDGVLRRWRATPLPAWAYFAGRMAAAVVLADAAGLVLLGVGVSMAGLHLTAGAAASVLVAGTLGGLAMAAAATAVTPLLPSAQGANSILGLTYIPLLIFSNGLGSFSGLPHWLTTAMTYFPVQPVVDTATRALQHSGAISDRDVLVLLAWTVACLALSVRFFRWDPTRPAHAGRAQRTHHSSFAGNLWVSHRPAARGQRGEQRGGLGLPDGELSDSHRQAG